MPLAGNAHCPWALNEDVVERCRRRMRRLGIPPELEGAQLLQRLRQLPAAKLATKMNAQSRDYGPRPSTELGPRLSAPFFPAPLEQLRRQAPVKPLLIGLCEHEGLIFRELLREVDQGQIQCLGLDA